MRAFLAANLVCGFIFFALLGGLLAGCGSSVASAIKAGPIVFAGSSGGAQVSSLSVASSLQFSMMPVGDRMNAGVDWTVTCQGNPVTGSISDGACGTLLPAHTADGGATVYTAPSLVPIGTTVTITSTVTSNPAQSSSVSLTITQLSVGVAIASAMPSSLTVNTQLSVSAQLTNDTAGGGVAWTATCGSSACGTLSPAIAAGTINSRFATTYIAPADIPVGNTVTITVTSLTDTTRSASAIVTIVNPARPVPVTVNVLPANINVTTSGSGHSANLTAVVGNDSAAAGVDWSLTCSASNCGSITAHTASGAAATYNAPPGTSSVSTVTITAKSTTNPAVSASATASIIAVTPIIVTMSSAPPATLVAGSQATIAAKVSNDTNNLGVDWTATCGGTPCGSFNVSPAHTASTAPIVYTAPATVPAGGTVAIAATSTSTTTPSNPAVAIVSLLPTPASVSLTQAPAASMTALTQAAVSATIANDVAPGGVAWSVQCGSTIPGGCGWILPPKTASGAPAIYTAPPVTTTGTLVTIVATSVANPQSSASSGSIAISPNTTPSIAFVPSLPSQVAANATVNLIAAVANDTIDAGVDWYVCPSGCGFFTIKPAILAIPATQTTPYVPAVPAVTATATNTQLSPYWPNGWPNGLPIPYTAPAERPASDPVAVVATSHADSTKAISGTIPISVSTSGPALNGVVYAGAQPIVGASVSLYAAGTSGYASASSQLATTTTDKSGSFTVPASYTCPSPASQIYLVAKGGGVGSNAANASLALMTALGNCSNLSSSPVVVNEVTSVASAYATAQFAANDELTGNNSYLYLGTSSSNIAGLANAFATVNNLVDISTGQVRFMTPAANAAVPFVQINTIADALNACAGSGGGVEGDGSACGSLFTDADTLSSSVLYHAIGPSDTLQALFNVAQHPAVSYGYQPNNSGIVGMASSDSPFQPILSASDFSNTLTSTLPLSLHYTRGGGLSSAGSVGSLAIDSTGNLWITDTKAGSAIEWNTVGAAISPTSGFAAGGGPIAIDASGNVWISGDNALTELTNLGNAAPGSPFGGVAGGGGDIAIDAQSNLWITNVAGVNEFSSLGVPISPQAGFINSGFSNVTSVGIDNSNNVWLGGQTIPVIAQLTNPGGQLIAASPASVGGAVLPQMAADQKGDVWFLTSWLCKATPYVGGSAAEWLPACYSNEPGGAINSGELAFNNARGIALDGAGTVWIASQGGGGDVVPSLLPVVPDLIASSNVSSLASPTLAAGPLRVAIDGSGNVWVLLADNSVTEQIGVAVPSVTPTALGLKNKKLGAKP